MAPTLPRMNSAMFGDAMAHASSSTSDIEAKVREAATQFVASAFIMPVLAARHESPFATEPFKENSAQQRFAPMLDWQFADRIASASKFPLVEAIVKRMMQTIGASDAVGSAGSDLNPFEAAKGTLDVSG